jgi:hypothetical protein
LSRALAALAPVLVSSLVALGCADGTDSGDRPAGQTFNRPVPHIGRGPGFELGPAGPEAAHARPVAGMRCERGRHGDHYGVHLEIFARGLDVVIPAGIGIAPPRRRDGAYVRGGRCEYPVRTYEPTGLIEIDSGRRATLGQFFELWGQPLDGKRLLGFRASRRGAVLAYVNGQRWTGDPRAIPLAQHAAIVLEVRGYFPPTRRYLFPHGL